MKSKSARFVVVRESRPNPFYLQLGMQAEKNSLDQQKKDFPRFAYKLTENCLLKHISFWTNLECNLCAIPPPNLEFAEEACCYSAFGPNDFIVAEIDFFLVVSGESGSVSLSLQQLNGL